MKRTLITIALCLLAPLHVFATSRGVSPSGTDTGTCSILSCRTVNYGISQLVSGDTLSIADGTYTEGLIYNAIPDGPDDSHHTIVQAINAGMVTLNGHEPNGFVAAISGAYKTLRGVVLNESTATTGYVALYFWDGAHHILVEDVEATGVHGGTSACVTAGGDGTSVHDITMRRLRVHDCKMGSPTTHGVYLHMRDSTIEDSEIYDVAGYGIQQYSNVAVALSNNTIQRNKIHDVAQDGTNYGALYLGQTNSDNTRVLNNVMYNGGGPGSCIQEQGTLNTLIYNNTCADFAAAAGVSGFIREGISGADLGSIAKNNVGWGNTPLNTIVGSAWTQSNNTCGSGCASSSDPLFVNDGTGDFHLSLGSPAIGAGVNLCGTFCTDIAGTPRAPVAAWDQGAYAYASTTLTIPPALTTLGAGAN